MVLVQTVICKQEGFYCCGRLEASLPSEFKSRMNRRREDYSNEILWLPWRSVYTPVKLVKKAPEASEPEASAQRSCPAVRAFLHFVEEAQFRHPMIVPLPS
jgi:hypothetical protein